MIILKADMADDNRRFGISAFRGNTALFSNLYTWFIYGKGTFHSLLKTKKKSQWLASVAVQSISKTESTEWFD